jgi:hypothetical protein
MIRSAFFVALAWLAATLPATATDAPSASDRQHALVPSTDIDDLSVEAKDLIKEKLKKIFMYPDLVLWKYDSLRPYPTGGVAVCGQVNYPDSTRAYTGYRPFFAVIRDGKLFSADVPAREDRDPRQEWLAAFHIACG